MGSVEKKIIVQKNWISVMEDKFKMPYNQNRKKKKTIGKTRKKEEEEE